MISDVYTILKLGEQGGQEENPGAKAYLLTYGQLVIYCEDLNVERGVNHI